MESENVGYEIIRHPRVEGLTIVNDAISPEMHDKLWIAINKEEWNNDLKRRVQHYGFKYNYTKRSIDKSDKIGSLPKWATDLCDHLMGMNLVEKMPNQLIVNEYKSGQGISRHIDNKAFGGTIFSISLGSACRMKFTRSGREEIVHVIPKMFMKMESEARYNWFHEIPALSHGKRISLTFRYVDVPSDK